MGKKLIIAGAGQYGMVVQEIAEATGEFEKIAFLDDRNRIAIGSFNDMERFAGQYDFAVVAVGNAVLRLHEIESLKRAGYHIFTLIHPKAYVSPSATLGEGCIIEPGAVILSGASLGAGVIVSANSVVNHNATIGNACHVDVGAVIQANSVISSETRVIAGSIVCDQNTADDDYSFEVGM